MKVNPNDEETFPKHGRLVLFKHTKSFPDTRFLFGRAYQRKFSVPNVVPFYGRREADRFVMEQIEYYAYVDENMPEIFEYDHKKYAEL